MQRALSKRFLLVVKVIVVLMNVTFASSRKVAKKGVDVNVHVEKAVSDRELRGLCELRELAQSDNQKVQWHTRCTH